MTTTKQLAEKLLELIKTEKEQGQIAYHSMNHWDAIHALQDFVSDNCIKLCTAYLKLEEENEKLLGAKLAYYMVPTRHMIGKTTRLITDMIQQMRPNSEIKVTTPDVEKLESDLEQQKKINSKLEKQLEVCKQQRDGIYRLLDKPLRYKFESCTIESLNQELEKVEG
jgi:predicted RNase H-like nuclease (RuvC/YqgF family)